MVSYVPKDIDAILKSLVHDNDRSVALVGASLLEHSLEEVIKSRLRSFDVETDKADLERLFGINGIFSGLSGKITSAFALKIIGPVIRRDLDLLNKIRNEFAHDMNPLFFSDERIKNRCRELNTVMDFTPKIEDDARSMYIISISLITGMLSLRGQDQHPSIQNTPESLKLLAWLDR